MRVGAEKAFLAPAATRGPEMIAGALLAWPSRGGRYASICCLGGPCLLRVFLLGRGLPLLPAHRISSSLHPFLVVPGVVRWAAHIVTAHHS